jgi:hypothetical protein
MAKTSAETTLGEDIHTRTTGDAVESQAVVIGIDGSDDVVPAHATDGLSVKVTNQAPTYATLFDSHDENLSSTVYNSDDNITAEDVEALHVAPYMVDDADGRYDRIRGTIANGLDVDVTRVQGNVAVTGTFWQATQPVSLSEPISVDDNGGSLTVDGTVALDSASLTALETTTIGTALPAGNNNIGDVDIASALPAGDNNIGNVDIVSLPTVTVSDGGSTISVDDGAGSLTVDGSVAISGSLPAGNNVIGQVDINSSVDLALDAATLAALETVSVAAIAAGDNNIGNVDIVTMPAISGTVTANLAAGTNNIGDVDVLSLPALPAGTNNIGDVDVLTLPNSATATLSNVATSNVNATLLASNTARKGAVIYNDSLVVMYVKFGTTASSTSFTYYLAAGATLELPTSPGLYTGRIDGILASSTGNARVTELT